VRAKIAEMPEDDRAIAARIHEIVHATAPELVPRTFCGMPAYARDGKVICFFQAKSKFKCAIRPSASSPTRGSTTRRCDRSPSHSRAWPRRARSESPSWSRRPRAESRLETGASSGWTDRARTDLSWRAIMPAYENDYAARPQAIPRPDPG
jgi:hypothetical protein